MMIAIYCPGAEDAKPISAAGRPVYTAPECADYAKTAFQDVGTIAEEPRLNEAPDAGLLWRLGLQSAGESAQEVKQRAGSFVEALLKTQTDCVLVASPNILRFLLRALEKRRCVIRRGQSGAVQPGEHIRVTERSDHCGGCQHNCLLSNPGCGVGRDKAMRGY